MIDVMADACANGTEACAACGKAGCSLKVCNACKTTKYCSRDCQLSHWRGGHKDECKRMVAEQAMNVKLSQIPEATDEELFAPHPPQDECPICFLPHPMNDQGTQYMACCGKELCHGCVFGHISTNGTGSLCPFCRSRNANGTLVERLQKRVQANDATACHTLGSKYEAGSEGVPQNMDKAMTLYFRGAELGSAQAHFHLGGAYLFGEGLKEDLAKAIHHLEIGALGGNVDARFCLACLESKGRREGRAVKHFMILSRAGHDDSLEKVRDAFRDGLVTKDDYEKVLRDHKESSDAMKSSMRDEAHAIWIREREDMS
ncbi:hypothetical protein ACHAXT_010648 [Thalassiosira profunda]